MKHLKLFEDFSLNEMGKMKENSLYTVYKVYLQEPGEDEPEVYIFTHDDSDIARKIDSTYAKSGYGPEAGGLNLKGLWRRGSEKNRGKMGITLKVKNMVDDITSSKPSMLPGAKASYEIIAKSVPPREASAEVDKAIDKSIADGEKCMSKKFNNVIK